MKKNTAEFAGRTVGMDVGDEYCHLAALDCEGELVEETRITTSRKSVDAYFARIPRSRVVVEAGTHSRWISRIIEKGGHEVIVANPRRLALIYGSDSKSDRNDAVSLARLGRVDVNLLSPIKHRDERAHADLVVIRSRDVLVKSRTQMVNHVRGITKSFGVRLRKCSTDSFHRHVRESMDSIPEVLHPAVVPMLDVIEDLSKRIHGYDKSVEDIARKRYPETERLRQVAGVGPLTALAYVLTIEDPDRFPTSRKVGSYLGLRPRRDASGSRDPALRITKAGNSTMRRLLVGSAQYILGPFGPDCDLRRWGMKLTERGGKNAKKRAVVSVARKLSVLLHRLWVTGADYDPMRSAKRFEQQRENSSASTLSMV